MLSEAPLGFRRDACVEASGGEAGEDVDVPGNFRSLTFGMNWRAALARAAVSWWIIVSELERGAPLPAPIFAASAGSLDTV